MHRTHELNRLHWDEVTPRHFDSTLYDTAGFLAGGCTLGEEELALLGDLRGRRLLHLQCHFGLDTLSLARRGAKVTGVDFSDVALQEARRLAATSGLDDKARFVQSDVLELELHLHQRFDIVFTSIGAICWLADIVRWGEVVAALTAPDGRFVFLDDHPIALVHYPGDGGRGVRKLDYFLGAQAVADEAEPDYADPSYRPRNVAHTHIWPVSEVTGALERAGMWISGLREYPGMRWQLLPGMLRDGRDNWTLPPGEPRLPLMYGFTARHLPAIR